MLGNRRTGTGPELAVRRLLHASGLRYRVDHAVGQNRRRRPDIVFTRARVAVFIDGCFWHSCPEHATEPVRNSDYWGPKLARNRERDRETTADLEREGWTVLRFWEHEDPSQVAGEIVDAVKGDLRGRRGRRFEGKATSSEG